IAATSNPTSELEIRHYRTAQVLQRRPAGEFYQSKYGAGFFQVHRADLHGTLSAAVLSHAPACIQLNRAFASLVQDESSVAARFSDGTVAEGDALIGCDGGRSTVREKIHGSGPAAYTGQVSFRALIPAAILPERLKTLPRCMHIGPGRTFVHYPLRKGSIVNVVGNARQSRWEDEGWTIPAEVSELLELYSD